MGMPEVTRGAFHSTKITVWYFGNFKCPMERYIPVAKTWPKPPFLVIVLVSKIQKSGTEDNNFCQMGRDTSVRPTEMTRPVKVDHLQNWSRIFRSDQTEMVRSILCANRNKWRAAKDCRLSFRQVRNRMLPRFAPSGFFCLETQTLISSVETEV